MRPSAAPPAEPAPQTAPAAAAEEPVSTSEPISPPPLPSDGENAETKSELRLHPRPVAIPRARRHGRRPKAKHPRRATPVHKPLVSNIPQRAFFKYYNTLQDRILTQIPSKTGKLLLNRFFRLTYGFNRNWCRVSQVALANHTGASQINHVIQLLRKDLAPWVFLVEKGTRGSPGLWVLDLGSELPQPWDLDGAKIVSREDTLAQAKETDSIN